VITEEAATAVGAEEAVMEVGAAEAVAEEARTREQVVKASGLPSSASRRFALMACGRGEHPVIISTLYLPEIIVNLRYQHAPLESVCAGQTKYSVIIDTVR